MLTDHAAEFAQVGNDMHATKFLGDLDNHPVVGPLIDATSSFEIEQDEMKRKSVSRAERRIVPLGYSMLTTLGRRP